MKRIVILTVGFFFSLLSLAAPASATGNDKPEISGKPVTVCHATGSASNPYVKLENVPLVQFLDEKNGHGTHSGDIWAAFSYVKRTGPDTWETVNVPAQGDTSLLAFEKCEKPDTDTKIAKPTPVIVDKCATKDDSLSVAPGTGYTVGAVTVNGLVQTVVVTLADGFKWADGSTAPLTFTHTFTNVDCDLPDTGVGATFNTTGGYLALGALAIGGAFLITGGRRKAKATI